MSYVLSFSSCVRQLRSSANPVSRTVICSHECLSSHVSVVARCTSQNSQIRSRVLLERTQCTASLEKVVFYSVIDTSLEYCYTEYGKYVRCLGSRSNAYYRPFSGRQPLQPAKGALRALPAFLRKPPRALFAYFPNSGVSIGKVLLPQGVGRYDIQF